MSKDNLHKIRPAGRHIFTIGRDLIKDPQAAIIELVKNAYDADSPSVDISFEIPEKKDKIIIKIKDFGHGMTKDDVLNKWLVPSTDNKKKQKHSPKGRIMQGEKGVGRYAASLIGNDLLLDTVDKNGNKSQIYINWDEFNKYKYLDEVNILVEFSKVSDPSGTELIATGDIEQLRYWTKKDINGWESINELKKELKKMLSPNKDPKDIFEINLILKNFEGENEEINTPVKPFPFFDIYDYRIYGKFNKGGKGKFKYQNFKSGKLIEENINLNEDVRCGNVEIDIKVYDREPDALKNLIGRGLTDENGAYLNIQETKNILNAASGIGVYRNGFRIRPLGDPGFDWLHLDTQRVQNPSFNIGNNQVIGIINIENEDKSGLEEKSARDGLKENEAYKNLVDIINVILNVLERKRFDYRRLIDEQNKNKIHKTEGLLDYSEAEKEIEQVLLNDNISVETTKKVLNVISKTKKEKEEVYSNISEHIAKYEGQATLGKIMDVVLHEARKPLNFFSNQIKNTEYWANQLKDNYSEENLNNLLDILSDYKLNTKLLTSLFRRLDPLSSKNSSSKKKVNINKIIKQAINIFQNKINDLNIDLIINCEPDIMYFAREQDLIVILTNLIENSIYWIEKNNPNKKIISISVQKKLEGFELEIIDTGEEIPETAIDSGSIFEPGYTSKPKGTGSGLGLALAGEAALRNNLYLKAISHKNGAHFKLETKEVVND